MESFIFCKESNWQIILFSAENKFAPLFAVVPEKKRQRKLSLDDVADCADEEDNDVVQGVFSLVPPLKVLSTKKLI